MANCVIAYNPCFSCDEKKCEICELDMHRKRVFQQSEGEWVTRIEDFHGEVLEDKCSVCGFTRVKNNTIIKRYNFCPNCGAKMKGGE